MVMSTDAVLENKGMLSFEWNLALIPVPHRIKAIVICMFCWTALNNKHATVFLTRHLL